MIPQEAPRERFYKPDGITLADFHASPAFVRGLMGPLGSGKSTACVMEILTRAGEQAVNPNTGLRHTRWAIIRNSYPELKTTTLKTWGQWCPAQFGKLTMDSPIRHYVKNNEIEMEIYFIALDKPDDVKKLLSLELTGAWINEAREIPKAILDALTGRVGRYPAMIDGGPTWYGIIMDTNPPDDQSWWYKMAEEETPENWAFFQQPGGESPEAENTKNLIPNYYKNLKAGKDADWIKVYVHGEYGYVIEGKPVFKMYRDRIHCSAPENLEPIPGFALMLGVDFGLTPACIIGQKTATGRWLILDELVSDGTGVKRFGETLKKYLAEFYPDFDVAYGWGDPAGDERAQTDEKTPFEIINAAVCGPGEKLFKPAPTNDVAMRQEVVINSLNRLVDGNPGILISPKCKVLRKGFISGYHFKAVRTGNGEVYHDTPAKNQYSHPHDALQYLLLGGGEADVVLNKERTRRHHSQMGDRRKARGVDFKIFNRGREPQPRRRA